MGKTWVSMRVSSWEHRRVSAAPRGGRGEVGLSLVELLVAVTLFSFVLLVTMTAFGRALRMTRDAEERTLAAEVARRLSEVVQAQELGRDNAAGNRFIQVQGFARRALPVEGSPDPPLPRPFQGVALPQPQPGEPTYRFDVEVVTCPVWVGGGSPWDYSQCSELEPLSLKRVEIRVYRPGQTEPLVRLTQVLDDQ